MGRRSRDPVQSSPATTGARSPGVRLRLAGGRAHALPLRGHRRSWISADRAANFSAVIPGGSADERGQVRKWTACSVLLDFLDVNWGQSQPHVLRHKCLRLCRITKKDEADQSFILRRQRKGRPSLTRLSHPTPRTGGSDICKWLIDNGCNFDSCVVGTITVDFHEFLFTRPLSPVTLALLL